MLAPKDHPIVVSSCYPIVIADLVKAGKASEWVGVWHIKQIAVDYCYSLGSSKDDIQQPNRREAKHLLFGGCWIQGR